MKFAVMIFSTQQSSNSLSYYFISPKRRGDPQPHILSVSTTAPFSLHSLPLEHHQFLSFEVRHVQQTTLLFDSWVFAHQQPTHVRKEKAMIGIVRISVCF
jgi:hypothetical protein